RLGAGHGGEGAGGRVGEGDAEGGPADLAEADGVAHLRGARGDVRAGALAAQLLDLVAPGSIVRGEVLDLAAAVLEHADHVAALVADGAATGEACGGGEEDAAQHHDDGDTSPSARTVTRTTLASCCAVGPVGREPVGRVVCCPVARAGGVVVVLRPHPSSSFRAVARRPLP